MRINMFVVFVTVVLVVWTTHQLFKPKIQKHFYRTLGLTEPVNIAAIVQEMAETYKKCMKSTLVEAFENRTKFWQEYVPAVGKCSQSSSDLKKINILGYSNFGEVKYFIHNVDNNPVTVVTLGVGEDVTVETHLKKIAPNGTEFFAADPIYEKNKDLFSPIGTFFNMAVGGRTGVEQASVYRNGSYVNDQMFHVNLLVFLKHLIQRNVVDWLLMDSEGSEYDLVPLFFKNGEIDQNGIIVCQLNVEFHGYEHTRWFPVLKELIEDGRWIVMRSENVGHIRTFMFNTDSEYCNQRFLAHYYMTNVAST